MLALGGNLPVEAGERLRALQHGALGAYRQAEGGQRIEHGGVAGGQCPALRFAQPVGKEREGTARSNFGVELADAARRRIPRIDQGLAAGGLRFGVEAFEIGALHVDFATHFQHGRGFARKAQGNFAHGAHVPGHIFAGFTITARRRLDEQAVFVTQVDRQTIEFEFGDVFDGRLGFAAPQFAPQARVESESTTGLDVGFGADRAHRHGMVHRLERVQRQAADPLCRRIGAGELRMCGFERLQFLKQPVILGVGQKRRVEHVVVMVEALDLRTKFTGALLG